MRKLSHLERFHLRYRVTDTGCWEWRGSTDDGYGRFGWDNKKSSAHKWAYEYFIGPVPDGLELDHLCRNKGCVNPTHLEPVTHQENMRRGRFGQKTHCPQGHPYSGENLRMKKTGYGRECRACQYDSGVKYREKNRAGA